MRLVAGEHGYEVPVLREQNVASVDRDAREGDNDEAAHTAHTARVAADVREIGSARTAKLSGCPSRASDSGPARSRAP